MARILAIDYGTKRIGIAVTDPLQMIASGLVTVRSHEIFDFLKDYFSMENVECLVLGYPRKMNNKESQVLTYVKQFETAFKRLFPSVPVIRMDERFTSKMAMDTMIRGGVKKKDRQNKERLDKISAAIILQDYLEQKRNFK
jgi:putative holliday junction resolvase